MYSTVPERENNTPLRQRNLGGGRGKSRGGGKLQRGVLQKGRARRVLGGKRR